LKTGVRNRFQQFERLWCWYYWWEGCVMYVTDMAPDGMIYTVTWLLNVGSVHLEKHCKRRPLLDNGSLTHVSAATDRIVETKALYGIDTRFCGSG
jgi:hypothetical protein